MDDGILVSTWSSVSLGTRGTFNNTILIKKNAKWHSMLNDAKLCLSQFKQQS